MPIAPLSYLYGCIARLERARRVLVGDIEAVLGEESLNDLRGSIADVDGHLVTYGDGVRQILIAYESQLHRAVRRAQIFEHRPGGYPVPTVVADELKVYWHSRRGHTVWLSLSIDGQWRLELALDGEAVHLAAGGEALRAYWLLGLFPPPDLAGDPGALRNAVAGLVIAFSSSPSRVPVQLQIEALTAHIGLDIAAVLQQIRDRSANWHDPAGWIEQARQKLSS